MGAAQTRVVAAGVLLVLVLLSGLWVSRAGKPYRTLPFTIHKLAGLATGILLGIIVYQTHQAAPLGVLEIAAIVATVFFFGSTVAAGGLLSAKEHTPTIILRLHQVLPVLSLLSAAATLYLLLQG
jgi:hypothetical protein